ncbi:MAG: class I adenylate-forming enzyme family protein [Dehalococcoidia bacterium]|jgi:acyl-CoA synthetase (AMP-forming)/AMP-acid ligase II
MGKWPNAADVLRNNAYLHPDKMGAKDLSRSLSFKEWDDRANRLANALLGLGLKPGDRFAAIAYNCVEWMEIYAAAAKGGLTIIPILFRLTPSEYQYICQHGEAKAFITAKEFVEGVDSIRDQLSIPPANYLFFGDDKAPAGYQHYEDIITKASPAEPRIELDDEAPWTITYTSGTTGKPKGVVRSHRSFIANNWVQVANMGFVSDDSALLVMPMSHINSIFFSWIITWVGGGVCIYNRTSFDPEHYIKTMQDEKVTFTSLVPTHYVLMLDLPEEIKAKYDVSSMRKLLCSSAPVRKETKLQAMDYWKGAGLYEGYGTTETDGITLLRPHEQLNKLRTIGKEMYGVERIRLLDEDGNAVPEGEVGEICVRTPAMFTEYLKDPEKTKDAFRFGGYFHTGDMALRDDEGYYILVDRKADMIITGGENVFPSEVEQLLAGHPKVKEVAVVGVPDHKWGEAIEAVIVPVEGTALSKELEQEIIDYCRGKIAGYKRPKAVKFIRAEEMPRTATGKIMRRGIREWYQDK